VDYLTITAPYDGVVLARNVNLGDFVLPASGDPSQGAFSLGVSPNQATPLYLLNRIDPVLFVIGVPEADAAYVDVGSTARVRVPALANHEFPARVTRTSWALNPTSRTLMAQVELPNPKGKFLPGMYAYGSVLIERPSVRAVPVSAITQIGNQTYCYLALDGKAARTPVQTGVSDGTWVEVAGKLVQSAGSSEGTWKAFDGSEAVIFGDLSLLVDGAPVDVAPDKVETKEGRTALDQPARFSPQRTSRSPGPDPAPPRASVSSTDALGEPNQRRSLRREMQFRMAPRAQTVIVTLQLRRVAPLRLVYIQVSRHCAIDHFSVDPHGSFPGGK
jgi:Barrel-sandwich domain of CusB or HlyD membrane-fusion